VNHVVAHEDCSRSAGSSPPTPAPSTRARCGGCCRPTTKPVSGPRRGVEHRGAGSRPGRATASIPPRSNASGPRSSSAAAPDVLMVRSAAPPLSLTTARAADGVRRLRCAHVGRRSVSSAAFVVEDLAAGVGAEVLQLAHVVERLRHSSMWGQSDRRSPGRCRRARRSRTRRLPRTG